MNEWTYPNLTRLFKSLRIPLNKANMGFSASVPMEGGGVLEWAGILPLRVSCSSCTSFTPPTLFEGNGLSSVFAQPLNVLRPAFWSMLFDILRFNRICKRLACGDASAPEMQQTLKKFLHDHGFGAAFKNW